MLTMTAPRQAFNRGISEPKKSRLGGASQKKIGVPTRGISKSGETCFIEQLCLP